MATIPLGLYLWTRIKQIGVSTVMGVPGDFNLEILDYVYEVDGLNWVSNANELNAAYAADGYARTKGVPGVFVTTHGVGELSAVNGVAGSHCEQVKVIHVVGQTTRAMQKQRMLIHHSISNDPDHQVYSQMSKGARIAEAQLMDPATAPAEIDRVIRECFIQSRPVYIFMPLDMSWEQVPAELLKTPIDLSLPVDQAAHDSALSAITAELSNAKSPAIFVDGLTHRHGAVAEARELVQKFKIPVYCANMGKCIIDDTSEYFVGLYNGTLSSPGVEEAFLKHDTVLVLGNVPADTNTGGFTRKLDDKVGIFIDPFTVKVKGKPFQNTFLKPLIASLAASPPSLQPASIPRLPSRPTPPSDPSDKLLQSSVWKTIVSHLQPHDIVIAETGTATFGLSDHLFPANTRMFTQNYYGSIGWATAATLGVEIALTELAKEKGEPRGRTVLVTGDGSFGLTMQEVGSMIRYGFKPVIILINNGGYTIERVIHGARQSYNSIAPLTYPSLLPLFTHPSPSTHYFHAPTTSSLTTTLLSPTLLSPTHLALVEIVLTPLDVPWRLSGQIALRGKQAVRYLREEGFSGWEKEGRVPVEWVGGQGVVVGEGGKGEEEDEEEEGGYWGEVQRKGGKGEGSGTDVTEGVTG